MTRFSLSPFALAAAVVLALPSAARAADPFRPTLSGAVGFEVQNDLAFSSDDATQEFNSLSAKAEPALTLMLTDALAIDAGITMETVQDPAVAGGDRFFDDHGAYIDTLRLAYARDGIGLTGGKMGVNFGIAWDATPGVFGTDLAEEYEMSENIVLGASLERAFGSAGTHTLGAETFFADTSGLAESAFTRRRKTRQGDGGPGNTGDFSSFALALSGGDFAALPGFGYHAAYVHHADQTTGAEDEKRFAIAATYEAQIGDALGIAPLVEYVHFADAEGTDGQDRWYLTLGAGLTHGNWNMALSATFKQTEAADGTETDTEQVQISAGYAFANGIGLDVGYKRARDAGVDTDTFGTLLTYAVEF